MSLVNLRKALKEGKLKIGVEESFKLLKKGKLKEIFLSINFPEDKLKRVEKYCEISSCKITKLKENSKDLGAVCKKPFSISICSYLK